MPKKINLDNLYENEGCVKEINQKLREYFDKNQDSYTDIENTLSKSFVSRFITRFTIRSHILDALTKKYGQNNSPKGKNRRHALLNWAGDNFDKLIICATFLPIESRNPMIKNILDVLVNENSDELKNTYSNYIKNVLKEDAEPTQCNLNLISEIHAKLGDNFFNKLPHHHQSRIQKILEILTNTENVPNNNAESNNNNSELLYNTGNNDSLISWRISDNNSSSFPSQSENEQQGRAIDIGKKVSYNKPEELDYDDTPNSSFTKPDD